MRSRSIRLAAATVALLALIGGACSSSEDAEPDDTGAGGANTLEVPADYKTIQEAVDNAEPGDLVLVSDGVYKEAVNVTTEDLTIRGTDRNNVILDGEFKLENGIRILDAGGVVVENMTARNYTSNGFFWTGVDGYRGSYLTAYRNGDYGVYAFDSVNGQLDNSFASGSPDAGFYIGQCYMCNAVIDNVVSEYNGLGYSGTNSGGELYILNSTFRFNRAGIVPNSGSYELCYPERDTTVVGNRVYSNNQEDAPGISVSLLAMGNGILVAGGSRNVIERNLVWDHDRTGIALVPFPEEDANDLQPDHSTWDTPCSETADEEVPPIPADKCKSVEGILKGCAVLWNPFENEVRDNVIEDSRVADLTVGTVDLLQTGETTETLNNCFSGNTFKVSAPLDLEKLAPCGSAGSGGDWTAGALDLLELLGNPAPKPPDDAYHKTPIPPAQENMPDAAKAPAAGGFKGPKKVDVSKVALPEKPKDA